jgi:hypothetical protein
MRVICTQQQEIGRLGIQLDRGAIHVLNREHDIKRGARLCAAGRGLYLDDEELILRRAGRALDLCPIRCVT